MILQHNASGPSIECPNCGCIVDIEEALGKKIEHEFRKEMAVQRQEMETRLRQREAELKTQEEEFAQRKQRENTIFAERLEKEKQKLEEQLALRIEKDFALQLAEKEKELNVKTERLQALQEAEIENARLKRTLTDQQKELELQFENTLTEQLRLAEQKTAQREQSRSELQLREKDKQLEDQKKLIDELKRKAGQGSMQLQGEVQEMAIADWLRSQFPLDTIDDIRTGARGADCLQTVHTREHQNCGTIYYESKRTKDFQPAWIEKFKADMREKNADIGVIVTQTMPKDMPAMGQVQGIWICTYEEFKGLSLVLREMLLRIRVVTNTQVNKADKKEMIYAFFTSQEFRMYVDAVVEAFTQMRSDLQREKNAMQKLWKRREKQIQKVLENTSAMVGAVQGIGGSVIPDIALLQLNTEHNDED